MEIFTRLLLRIISLDKSLMLSLREPNLRVASNAYKYRYNVILFITLFCGHLTYAQSSLPSFNCPSTFYQVISGELREYNAADGTYGTALNTLDDYNAGGYNPIDNYLYAVYEVGTTASNHVIRIGSDGNIEDLGELDVTGPGGTSFIAADFDNTGSLYLRSGANLRQVDGLNTLTPDAGRIISTTFLNNGFFGGPASGTMNAADIAFINGSLYGTNDGSELYIWDLTTPSRTIVPITGLPVSGAVYGAAYTDANDRLYVSFNDGGLYLINDYTTTPVAQYVASTVDTNRNDGFSCPTAGSAIDQDKDNSLDVVDLDLDGDGLTNLNESPSDPFADGDADLIFAYLDDNDAVGAIGNVDGLVETAFDTDGDGVPDFFDLDSDNDGIYDVVEAGHGLPHTDGKITGQDTGSGANGLFDGVETSADSGTINYIIADTDAAGNLDFQSTDADGDSCADAVEGASTFIVGDLDGDNSLGDVVDVNGVPTVAGSPQNTTAAVTDAGDTNACGPASSLTAFNCPSSFYQVISGELRTYNPVTGEYSVPIATTEPYNATGYNRLDNYVYAIGKGGGSSPIHNHLIRIGEDGAIEDLGEITGFGSGGISGDVDDNDNLWINIGEEYHRIDNLSRRTVGGSPALTPVTFTGPGGSTLPTGTVNDVAFINGSLYGVDRDANLHIYNLTSFEKSLVGGLNVPTSTTVGYGAAFADGEDRLYVSFNDGGLYLINDYTTGTPTGSLLNNTVVTTSNDGFACPSAPSTIDDDEDITLDPIDIDVDGDGITNVDESPSDPYADGDTDGVFAYLDDNDGDGAIGNDDGAIQGTFDTDGDGVPDFFDLDSDNDGIYDVVEAGHGLPHTNGKITGQDTGSGNNGLFDGAESPADSGTINYTIANTDSTGDFDFQSIDADADGCPDAVEGAGSFFVTDLDVDNSLGDIVDADGVPTISGSPQNTTAVVTNAGDNTACDDGDNITDIIENAAPNGGDGNGDGILDSFQGNVGSIIDGSGGGTYVTLEITSGTCSQITNMSALTEAAVGVTDPDFNYPVGLIDFTLQCGSSGDIADITYYWHGISTIDFFRKYGSSAPGAMDATYGPFATTIGTALIDGVTVPTTTYSLTDGLPGDESATSAEIVDPSGPALSAAAVVSVDLNGALPGNDANIVSEPAAGLVGPTVQFGAAVTTTSTNIIDATITFSGVVDTNQELIGLFDETGAFVGSFNLSTTGGPFNAVYGGNTLVISNPSPGVFNIVDSVGGVIPTVNFDLFLTFFQYGNQLGTGGGTEGVRTMNVSVTEDGTLATGSADSFINVQYLPNAVDDVNSILANATLPISGDLEANDTDLTTPETLTISEVNGITAAVGNPFASTYGTITVQPNGNYDYTVDTSNIAVSGLRSGASLIDIISYAIQDIAGNTDYGFITITINGVDELPVATDNANNVTVNTNPTATGSIIFDDDGFGVDTGDRPLAQFIWENQFSTPGGVFVGLSAPIDGQARVEPTTGVTLTFTTNDPDGIGVANQDQVVNQTGTNGGHFGYLQFVIDASVNPSQSSTLTIDFDEPVVNLSFTLSDIDWSQGDSWQDQMMVTGSLTGANVSYIPQVSGSVTQVGADTFYGTGSVPPDDAHGNVSIYFDTPVDQIVFDYNYGPDATAADNGTQIAGVSDLNWQGSGAPRISEINGNAANVGVQIPTTYGFITVNGDGTYTYVVDDTNPAVINLLTGNTLTDLIAYTLIDTIDNTGNTATANLNITINGSALDTDTDNVIDSVDLDNDNDGILDSVECQGTLQPGTFTVVDDGSVDGNESGGITLPSGTAASWNITHTFSNGQLEQYALSTNNELYFYYRNAAPPNSWDLTAANFSVSAGAADIQLALYGYVDADVQLPEPPGPDFGSRFGTYTISWVGGTGDAVINDPANQTDQADGATIINGGSFTQSGTIDNNLLQWNVIFPVGATSFTISATGGAAAEGFRFSVLENVCVDTDNDGIQDIFDLDSDNDGIYDVVEAGGTASTFPGQEGRQIDDNNNSDNTATNGIPSTVSPAGTAPVETTPGTPDYLNLNSDGDTCSDANEGANNNVAEGNDGGQYGDNDPQTVIDGEVGANGLVIAATYSNIAVPAVIDNTIFTACDDGDGVPAVVEDEGPNGGDGNNDGIPDSMQPHVASIPDAIGTGYVTLEVVVTGDCAQITEMNPLQEIELASLDDDYDYPIGLMDFTLACGAAGQSANVIIYWHNASTIDIFRKYGSTAPGANNATYNNFTTTVGTSTINGVVVPTTSYTITDGQPGDESATPALIVDPVGPAMPNADSDGDSVVNGIDLDDDNDGILDTDECTLGGGTFGTTLTDDVNSIFEITAETNPTTLANFLFAPNTVLTLVSSSVNIGSGAVPQIGTFNDGDEVTSGGGAAGAFVEFGEGIIFSSGNVLELDDVLSNQFFENEPTPPFATFGPALGDGVNGTGTAGGGTDPDFAGGTSEFDVASLEITVNVPAETSITGQFIFASDEYNDFVNGGVNDAAKVIVNGTNVALTSSGSELSIDTVNNTIDSAFYVDNETDPTAINIEADGFTTTITFSAVLNAGNNTIKMGVADNGDALFDSWLLFRANSFVLCYDRDTDNDNIADRLDLDSDNDGIYDTIEGGGTLSGATGQEGRHDDDNNNSDNVATNGVPSAANGGAGNTPTDTGSDGSLDFMTLDSDSDGCSDANEAYNDANADGGDGGVYNPGNVATEPLTDIAGTVDANGAVVAAAYTDPVDGDTDSTDDYQQIGGPDDDGDGTPNACDTIFNDVDNDGVGDAVDLDDDNDGILDDVERPCDQPAVANSNSGTGAFQNQLYFFNWDDPVFLDGIHDGDSQTFNLPDGLSITATFSNSVNANVFIPNNMQTFGGAALWQLYDTVGTAEAFYTLPANDGVDASFTITFVATKGGVPFPIDLLALDAETTALGSESIAYTTNGETWSFLESIGTGGSFSGVGTRELISNSTDANNSIHYSRNATVLDVVIDQGGRQAVAFGIWLVCDSDNDAIPNNLDLDADNDGIYDVIEAGGTDNNDDGRHDDDDNNVDNTATNGVPSLANGGAGITPTDTGSNGTLDYLTLDSDGDSCSDANEAYNNPTADGGDTGIFGTDPAAVDANGLVIAATYTDPVDGDTDSTDDYQQIGGPDGDGDGAPDACDLVFDDADNDGIGDLVDIDDDNDGILDTVECGTLNSIILDWTVLGLNAPTVASPGGQTFTDIGTTLSIPELVGVDITVTWTYDGTDTEFFGANGLDQTGAATPDTGANFYVQNGELAFSLNTPYDLTISNGSGRLFVGESLSYSPVFNGSIFGNLTPAPPATLGDIVITDDSILNPAFSVFVDTTDPPGWRSNGPISLANYTANSGNGEAGRLTIFYYNGNCDNDGDGIVNRLDLDSDNDGITDLTESGQLNNGATDTNNDGIIDGTPTDFGANGLANSVESDDTSAATTATPTNTDGTGGANYLDIDADNDGIVDNIEGQSTSGYAAPSGNDTDNDGIDDQYDSDCTIAICGLVGTPIVPENTDGLADGADYIDLDSDEDGESDTIEAYDTDDDGVANTIPANADADADGLDDNFDVDGTSTTDVGGPTNGGQTAGNPFPDTDSPGGEPNWRDPVVNDLEITKVDTYVDTNGNGIIDAGDTINYVFVVTNNGTATLTSISVTDSDPNVIVSGGPIASLVPAAVDNSTFTATYTILTADITAGNFSNTATVNAGDPNGNLITSLSDDPDDPSDATDDDNDGNPDDPTVTDLRQPLLDITKTDTYVDTNGNSIIDAGDTINYVFTVTNTGNVDLTGISVTDGLVTVTPATTIDLVVGASDNSTYTASYIITAADITAGSFSNTAVATAPNPLGGPDITDDSDDPDNTTDVDPDNDGSPDDPTVTDLSQPLLDITKTDTYVDTNGNSIIDAGDTINYVFTVTNTGNVDLTGISVTDGLVTVTPATTIDLVVGASDNSTYTASYTITAADITAGSFSNTAVASALNPLNPLGPPVEDDSDDPDDTTDVDPDNDGNPDDPTVTDLRQPLLDITKTDTYVDTNGNSIIDAGDTINYVFTVTNTGNVDLTGISVTDALVTVTPATTIDLVVGASDNSTYTASYTITAADITAGNFSNTAVATAPNPLGGPDITDDSDDPDDTTDVDPDNDGSPDDPTVTDLSQPLLDITKTDTYVDTNGNSIIDAGDTINYVFTVTNTGNVDLTGISVTDALATVTPATTIDLVVGASDNSTYTASYIITAADITAGSFSNQAVVSAPNPLDPTGPPVEDDSDDPDDTTDVDPDNDGSPDDPTVTDLRQPLLDITKTDTYVDTNGNSIIDAGDTINYVFTVTNTGNVDLTGISVTDALVTVTPATTIDLVVGASDNSTYTASYTITAADITAGSFSNTAVATAPNPLGGADITDNSDDPDNTTDVDPDNDGSPDDPTVTDLSQPLLDITKTDTYVDTNGNSIIDAGDTINYVFTVTNTGNVDLTGISVTDGLVTVTPATTIDLVVGASDNSTYTASYTITAGDITAGSFSNTAVASALNPLNPLGPPVEDDSDDPDDTTDVDPDNDGNPDDPTVTDLR
ncbi:DUF6923 family protein, partial [Aquimarina sp. 2201CG5-10]|uniref:DUF7507 domain-containing protein n=1 Tax=Aquimarina callyspongiae TaxID=3098150 RepID=UPI002AB389C4